MPHSVDRSISFPCDFLHPRKYTSFSLQLPEKWLIDQITNNPSINCKDNTIITGPRDPSEPCSKWITTLLRECVNAINEKNPNQIKQFLWLLNELVSPYGDRDQRLAYYFLQALITKAHNTASIWYENLKYVAEKNYCFKTKMDLILKFQEVSPWTTFGHVASNGAILEALEGESKLHVIELSNTTLCTQWPTLIEALATRYDETPSLRLTLVVTSSLEELIVNELRQRMERFARLMGVPFKLSVISGKNSLDELKKEDLGLQNGEAIVVNCIEALQRVKIDKRGILIDMFKSINPKIITIVEEEINISNTRNDFVKTFEECLRYYELYFEMLEESFNPISSDRYRLEREQSKKIARVLASCDDGDNEIGDGTYYWMPNNAIEWSNMMLKHGFYTFQYSDEVIGDVKALLRRYRIGWDLIKVQSNHVNQVGIHLTWRNNQHLIWASAWKPNIYVPI